MPRITDRREYNGFNRIIERHGLKELVEEALSTLGFQLLVREERHANGTRDLREQIDQGFEDLGGWTKVASGGIDWTKSNERGAKIGVEVQVSARSDLVAVDVMHLQKSLADGVIDVGIIIVPDDTLSRFLTDRTPNLRTAVRYVEQWASDRPVSIVAFRHDGPGEALPKMVTNLGLPPRRR